MAKKETAKAAAHLNGSKLYHERARLALPILVRQAKAGHPIEYNKLADELDIPNPRNLNFPLGSIGRSLKELKKQLGIDIPMIQSLVVTKNQGVPGDGIGGFFKLTKSEYNQLTKRQRRELLNAVHLKIYGFKKWDTVLKLLGLQPLPDDFKSLIDKARKSSGGGEGIEHARLKKYVLKHPELLGVKKVLSKKSEFPLASGDRLDVSFKTKTDWVAVEVKSLISNKEDLTRGIYQIIKYKAVMEAECAAGGVRSNIDAVLVVEGKPNKLIQSLANTLAVRIINVVKNGKKYKVI